MAPVESGQDLKPKLKKKVLPRRDEHLSDIEESGLIQVKDWDVGAKLKDQMEDRGGGKERAFLEERIACAKQSSTFEDVRPGERWDQEGRQQPSHRYACCAEEMEACLKITGTTKTFKE